MATELTITYDGESEALRAHRLSVGEMGAALVQLLSALRRTASGMARDAGLDESYGARGGKFSDLAKGLDLQISAIRDGCVTLDFQCVQQLRPSETADMWLADGAITRVLDDLEAEAAGTPRNVAVRKYLQKLPPYVTRQVYVARKDGAVLREVSIGNLSMVETTASLPRVIRFSGRLAKVGLERGKETISIRVAATGRIITLAATSDLVERALELRQGDVLITVTTGATARLLRIDPIDAEVGGTPEERLEHLTARWAVALSELAK